MRIRKGIRDGVILVSFITILIICFISLASEYNIIVYQDDIVSGRYINRGDLSNNKRIIQTRSSCGIYPCYNHTITAALSSSTSSSCVDDQLKRDESFRLLHDKTVSDDVYYKRLERRMRTSCGDLCNDDEISTTSSLMNLEDISIIKTRQINISCCSLYSEILFDSPASRLPPPRYMPAAMRHAFTLNGEISLEDKYFHQNYALNSSTIPIRKWNREDIDRWVQLAKSNTPFSTYSINDIKNIQIALDIVDFANKTILVVGSEYPWIEALLLARGVRRIVTLEHGVIDTNHPQVETITPSLFNDKYIKGEIQSTTNLFDGAISFSSLEHSGLGRYGDLINPWGDLIAVAKVWCVLKPKSYFILGLMSGGKFVQQFLFHFFVEI